MSHHVQITLIDHLRGDKRVHAVLSQVLQANERPATLVLTRVEILSGSPGEEAATNRLLAGSRSID